MQAACYAAAPSRNAAADVPACHAGGRWFDSSRGGTFESTRRSFARMSLTPTELETCLSLLERARGMDPRTPEYLRLEQAAAWLRKSAKQQRKKSRLAEGRQRDASLLASPPSASDGQPPARLQRARRCYVCKQPYRELHGSYHAMCLACSERSEAQRGVRANLSGRRALVTGGRVKIGHATALSLLRAGAHVTVTTRFARDAEQRFRQAHDWQAWGERLTVCSLDFRRLGDLLAQIERWNRAEPFDILVNNAAQSVYQPPAYYQELLSREAEHEPAALRLTNDKEVAQQALIRSLDVERVNSWVQNLGEIAPVDFVESQVVNAMAPFLLCSRLKPSLLRAPSADRYIVNVSAVEGQFSRIDKRTRHPHTNMAKAALNMLTRTSAADYARDGIYMVSVDPGWMSYDGSPGLEAREAVTGIGPPLDAESAAARVLDPVHRGVLGAPVFGVLLKDFEPVPW
jgi:NAD(P)-dependent dehydrogenase (short-subunit alcohol dehydrogenase family)